MSLVVFEVTPYKHIPGWWISQGLCGTLIGTWEEFEELSAWFTVMKQEAKE